MAQVKTASKLSKAETLAAAAANPANSPVQELKVTGHMMTLPVGLFSFINEVNPTATQQNGLPGVRVSLPPVGAQHVEIAGFRADGWLNADGDAALVRVRKGPAQVLVTIYQMPNQPDSAPKLQVRQLLAGNDMPAPAEAAVPAAAETPVRVDLMAHIQSRGDVGAKFGQWLGERGSNNWIEGFALNAPEGFDVADLSYQAVLGRGWLSPWVEAGQYCGSRGMALPLLGVRVRLNGKMAEAFDLSCSSTFVGGTTAGPVGNDETCEGDTLAPLEAIQLSLTPRARKATKTKR
ncbi:MAG TPA: hypothetical protein PLY97_01430 [Acidocella sp.]|nr:MAG: hypothetical protein B7Z81_03540 [Acidocella sp. 20-61-6]HQT45857.1 hypothetical protein [Acidocella sp.]